MLSPQRESKLTITEIDGSFGEGGGQTIRIATSFAVILGRPIRVRNVRAGRRIPGLRPQHSTTLRLLAEICGGHVEGANIGSTEFTFTPGAPQSRSLTVDMKTAASITLALQAIVPAISLSGSSLDLELIGGTDVPWSPTSDYISTVLSRSLEKIGVGFTLEVLKRGYYPNGGGRVRTRISPCAAVRPLELRQRSESPPIAIVSRAGRLPAKVAERQLESATAQLARHGLSATHKSIHLEESDSPGSSILVSAVGDSTFVGADSIGARDKPAQRVGSEAGARFARFFNSGACVDPHMADMLAPLLLLADGPSALLTSEVTEHLRTSLHIAEQLVAGSHEVQSSGTCWLVFVTPARHNS